MKLSFLLSDNLTLKSIPGKISRGMGEIIRFYAVEKLFVEAISKGKVYWKKYPDILRMGKCSRTKLFNGWGKIVKGCCSVGQVKQDIDLNEPDNVITSKHVVKLCITNNNIGYSFIVAVAAGFANRTSSTMMSTVLKCVQPYTRQ
jgi:hypothetical protein